ncbi:hypothetical protein BgiBS90_027603 [Biomphalaria glabrata]|nr:hypothetical protein BgiBS90_027603 [Biomphalaria glabrata]
MHHQLSPSCVLPAFEAARDLTVHHDKTSSGENSGMSDIYALFFLCCAGGKIPEGFFHVVALQSKRLLNLWLPISEFGQPAYAVGKSVRQQTFVVVAFLSPLFEVSQFL